MAKSPTRKLAIIRVPESDISLKGEDIKIGRNVVFGRGAIVHDSVTIESNTVIGPYAVIGEPLEDRYKSANYSNPRTIIGRDSVIRSGTVVYAGCRLGRRTTTGHYAVIRERTICGEDCSFGTYASSDGDTRIGDRCRFHYHSHICKNSRVGDDVWFFTNVQTLTDLHPPCGRCARGPEIKSRVVIGSTAVIMPGLTIGEDSVVAACTLVTKDVPPGMLVMGNPGRVIGKASNLRCVTGNVRQPYPWTKHYRRPG